VNGGYDTASGANESMVVEAIIHRKDCQTENRV